MGKEGRSPPRPDQTYSTADLDLMRLVICCMHAVRAAGGERPASNERPTISELEAKACRVIARQAEQKEHHVQTLWCGLRASSLRKLREHVLRGDVWARAPVAERLSALDWAVVDLLLLCDDCDTPISMVSYQQRGLVALKRTLEFVQRFQLEPEDGGAVSPEQWSRAAEWYSTKGVQMSAVALQRRWHELKVSVRQRACEATADEPQPQSKSVHHAVATRYPHVVDTSELPSWHELVAAGRVAEPTPAPHPPSEVTPKVCTRKQKARSTVIAGKKVKTTKLLNKEKRETKGRSSNDTPKSSVPDVKLAGSSNKEESNDNSISIIQSKNIADENELDNKIDPKITEVNDDAQSPKSNVVEAMQEIDVGNVDATIVYESDEDVKTILDVHIGNVDKDVEIARDAKDNENAKISGEFVNNSNNLSQPENKANNKLPILNKDSDTESAEDPEEQSLIKTETDDDAEKDVKPIIDFQIGSFQYHAKVYEDVTNYSKTVNSDSNNFNNDNKIAEYLGITDLSCMDPKLRMCPVISLRRIDDQDKTLLASPLTSTPQLSYHPPKSPRKPKRPYSKLFYKLNKSLLKRCKPCVVSLRRVDDGRRNDKGGEVGRSVEKESSEGVSKRVQLPDMEEVRRNNRGILTAEVAPVLRQYGPARKRLRLNTPDNQSSPPTSSSLSTNLQNTLQFIAPPSLIRNLGSSSMETLSSDTISYPMSNRFHNNSSVIDPMLQQNVLITPPTQLNMLPSQNGAALQNVQDNFQNGVPILNFPVQNIICQTQNDQNWPQVTDTQNVFTQTCLANTQDIATHNIAIPNILPQNWSQVNMPGIQVPMTQTGLAYVQSQPSMTIDGKLVGQGHQAIRQNQEPSKQGVTGGKTDLSQFIVPGSKPNTFFVPMHCCNTALNPMMNYPQPLLNQADLLCCSLQSASNQMLQPIDVEASKQVYASIRMEVDGSKTSFNSSSENQTVMTDNVQPVTLPKAVAVDKLFTPITIRKSTREGSRKGGVGILDWGTSSLSSCVWARGRSPESLCVLCTGLDQGWRLEGHLLVSDQLQPQPHAAIWSLSPRVRLRVPDETDSTSSTGPSSVAFQNRIYQKLSDVPLTYALLLVAVDSVRACERLMLCGAPLQLYSLRNCTLHPVHAQRLDDGSFQLSGSGEVKAPLTELSRCLRRLPAEPPAPIPIAPRILKTTKKEPMDRPSSPLKQNLIEPPLLELSAPTPIAPTTINTPELETTLQTPSPLKPNSLTPPTAKITPKLEPTDWTTSPIELTLHPSLLELSAPIPSAPNVLKTPKVEPTDQTSSPFEVTSLKPSLLEPSEGISNAPTVLKTPKLEPTDQTSSPFVSADGLSSKELSAPIPNTPDTIITPKLEPSSRTPSPTELTSLEPSLFEVPILNAPALLNSLTPSPEPPQLADHTLKPPSPIQYHLKTTSNLKTYGPKPKTTAKHTPINYVPTTLELKESETPLKICENTLIQENAPTAVEPSPLLSALFTESSDEGGKVGCTPDDFNLSEADFVAKYKLPKVILQTLAEELRLVAPNVHINKVLSCLQYLSSDRACPETSSVAAEVVDALNHESIVEKYIRFPNTLEERDRIKNRFMKLYKLPDVVGVIDGAKVPLLGKPLVNESCFNRGFHSLSVEIICDADLTILGLEGAGQHSWTQHLQTLHEGGENVWLLGDSGYLQRPTLMTPLPYPSNPPESHYNALHSHAWASVRRCINSLRCRWRRLTTQLPERHATNILKACAVLHNIAQRNTRMPNLDSWQSEIDATLDEYQERVSDVERDREARKGLEARVRLVKKINYGVPWRAEIHDDADDDDVENAAKREQILARELCRYS